MLRYSKIGEALAFLSDQTGRIWTESELFELATYLELDLTAVAPASARTVILTLKPGEGLVEEWRSSPGHALFAVLFPFQVMQIWMRGETTTMHPLDYKALHFKPKMFVEPVHVTLADVLISSAVLQRMLSAWQGGLSGEDEDGPYWIRPESTKQIILGTPSEQFPEVIPEKITERSHHAESLADDVCANEIEWDELNLRRLMAESQELGSTHKKLGEKYGVSRQRIGFLLAKAFEAYGVRKAGHFDALK